MKKIRMVWMLVALAMAGSGVAAAQDAELLARAILGTASVGEKPGLVLVDVPRRIADVSLSNETVQAILVQLVAEHGGSGGKGKGGVDSLMVTLRPIVGETLVHVVDLTRVRSGASAWSEIAPFVTSLTESQASARQAAATVPPVSSAATPRPATPRPARTTTPQRQDDPMIDFNLRFGSGLGKEFSPVGNYAAASLDMYMVGFGFLYGAYAAPEVANTRKTILGMRLAMDVGLHSLRLRYFDFTYGSDNSLRMGIGASMFLGPFYADASYFYLALDEDEIDAASRYSWRYVLLELGIRFSLLDL